MIWWNNTCFLKTRTSSKSEPDCIIFKTLFRVLIPSKIVVVSTGCAGVNGSEWARSFFNAISCASCKSVLPSYLQNAQMTSKFCIINRLISIPGNLIKDICVEFVMLKRISEHQGFVDAIKQIPLPSSYFNIHVQSY